MKEQKITAKQIQQKSDEKLLEAINRSDTDKFYHLMKLIKMNSLMKNAQINHKD